MTTIAKAGLAAGTLVVSACGTIQVTDETASRLTYNPPLNTQTFEVRVQSDRTVRNVDLIVPGVGSTAMTRNTGGRYSGQLPLAPCLDVAEFSVAVTTPALIGSGDDTSQFPEVGRFTHPISGQPAGCAGFAMSVAQTYEVDRSEDFLDADPGDGECDGAVPGSDARGCSLRAAVMEANAHTGADLIRLPPRRYVLTRDGSEGGTALNDSVQDLDITDTVTIEGRAGANRDVYDFLTATSRADRDEDLHDDPDANFGFAKIDSGGLDRIFQISGTATVVRLRQLALVNGASAAPGGAIFNAGSLALERVALADNRVASGAARTGGGAIHNDGLLLADDVAITHNAVDDVVNPTGGAIFNTGTATLRRSLLAYNTARFGNAIHNSASGVMRLENTTVHDHVFPFGGSVGTVNVIRNVGTMQLAFVTISGHRIDQRRLLSNSSDGELKLRNVLMIDNMARLCNGPIATLGGNLIEGSCTLTGPAGKAGTDNIGVTLRRFGGLDHRGGFTPIYPVAVPFSGSSTFNPADKAALPPFPFTDQRGAGFARNVDGDGAGGAQPDPGAFEIQ